MIQVKRNARIWKISKTLKRYPSLSLEVAAEAADEVNAWNFVQFAASVLPDFDEVPLFEHSVAGALAHTLKSLEIIARPSISELEEKYEYRVENGQIHYPSHAMDTTFHLMLEIAQTINRFNDRRHKATADWFRSILQQIKSNYPRDTTLLVCDRCVEARIPCGQPYSSAPLFYVFGTGANQFSLQRFHSGKTSHLGSRFATNKSIATEILLKCGLPVPKQYRVFDLKDAINAAKRIGYPVVIKPQNTDQGIGVMSGIEDEEELKFGFGEASRHGPVILQNHIKGFEYRIVVVNNVARRVVERIPAHVIGDAKSSVSQLIDRTAEMRLTHEHYKEFKFVEKDDPQVTKLLARQGYALDDIPEEGEQVWLRTNSNISTGGFGEVVTDRTHPENMRLAEHAAAAIGLDIAGVDLITPDISVPWTDAECGICEINPTPGMGLLEDVDSLMEYMTGGGTKNLTIPVVYVITGSDDADARSARNLTSWILDNVTDACSVVDQVIYEKRISKGIKYQRLDQAANVALRRPTCRFLLVVDTTGYALRERLDLCYLDHIVVFDSNQIIDSLRIEQLGESFQTEVLHNGREEAVDAVIRRHL